MGLEMSEGISLHAKDYHFCGFDQCDGGLAGLDAQP